MSFLRKRRYVCNGFYIKIVQLLVCRIFKFYTYEIEIGKSIKKIRCVFFIYFLTELIRVNVIDANDYHPDNCNDRSR